MPVSLEAELTDSSWRGEQLVTAFHKIGKTIAQKDIKLGNKNIQSLIDYAMKFCIFYYSVSQKKCSEKLQMNISCGTFSPSTANNT